jgi:SAM-dependent methyltransferase
MAKVSSRWEHPSTVAGFVSSPPNQQLLAYAAAEHARRGAHRCLDLGCGAARNAEAIAEIGYELTGIDLSLPMLRAAAARRANLPERAQLRLVHSAMTPLPFAAGGFDLVVAHGIWNLAATGQEFRSAVAEAARVAAHGAGLFLFTFARETLPPNAVPDPGETFVFSSWNGEPQCFLTQEQIVHELGAVGFLPEPNVPLTIYNKRPSGHLPAGGPPVIYEGTFRRAS